ncbi:rhythmically expressed gene 5 protein [Neocloeon triangulifer]|uniref:rhythmically expressed gene 5 protein n=1 Tax=Neocloeon triangulifer TaxID=2078957 RepID=UPI00286EF8C8|nr:rhythmically expressed gene 5 protein [Neocloeon triangulifer]
MLRLLLITSALVAAASSSGIPMWEYLDRSEKVNRLFHVFMRQVDDYCTSSDMPDCNKAMMVHGLSSLARMQDHHLDAMDPYQRDAHELIWDAMMHDHEKHHHDQPAHGGDSTNGLSKNEANQKEVDQEPKFGDEGAASNQEVIYAAPHAGGGPMMSRLRPDGSPVPGDPPGGHHMTPDMDMLEHRLMSQMPHHVAKPRATAKFPFLQKQ